MNFWVKGEILDLLTVQKYKFFDCHDQDNNYCFLERTTYMYYIFVISQFWPPIIIISLMLDCFVNFFVFRNIFSTVVLWENFMTVLNLKIFSRVAFICTHWQYVMSEIIQYYKK